MLQPAQKGLIAIAQLQRRAAGAQFQLFYDI
jgi:hypothetical protein